MKCESCGRDVAAESVFCPHCGARLADADPDSADAAAQPANAERLRPGGSRGSGNQPNEQDLWSGTYSPKAMAGSAIGLGILTVIAIIVGFLVPPAGIVVAGIAAVIAWVAFGLMLLYRRLSVRYRLTTYRFFHEAGLLNRTRNRIEVIDINDVTLQQGLIDRMFNVGTIHIQSSDVTDPDLYLPGIEEVGRVTDLIDNTRRAERQRRGLFMENIGGAASL
jgi:membrane protein YdbS with pleckstrin-like domain